MASLSGMQTVLASVEQALALLSDKSALVDSASEKEKEMPNLLDMCEEVLSRGLKRQPVRLVHHLACTGGTVISRAIALMPNVQLLSEIDPLSTVTVNKAAPTFAPTDLILGMRHTLREVDEALLIDMFLESLESLHSGLEARGEFLVLRSHSHSHYCWKEYSPQRPGIDNIVGRRLPVKSVLTVRHPLDSFISLVKNGWHLHFVPSTIDEYARRYRIFIDDHRHLPLFKYEEFALDPQHILQKICVELDLDFSSDAIDLLPISKISGDSGRSGDKVALRSRRKAPDWIASQAMASEQYYDLCSRLNYDPAF